jgi:hypothetical protein
LCTSGSPRTVKDEQIESIIVRTLESTPRDATHWSTRSMAEASGLSHMSIQRIWKTFGLEPHRSETFQLSTDPQALDQAQPSELPPGLSLRQDRSPSGHQGLVSVHRNACTRDLLMRQGFRLRARPAAPTR